DILRRPVGVIGPDPDGAGALLHRAMRLTYNVKGQVTFTEQGAVASQSDVHWAAFTRLARSATVYDVHSRPVQTRIFDGASATVAALTQQTYDAAGRPDCAALRLNPAGFGSVAPSCAPGSAGSFGADRIARTLYDAAGRPAAGQSGVG